MTEQIAVNSDGKRNLAAAGGVIGAVLASSCCIAPIVLITLGATGPWIGKLTALNAYQPLFVGLAVVFLGYGFWRVYWRPIQACGGESCAKPRSDRVVKVTLWTATLLGIVAVTTDFWAPLFY